MNKLGPGSSLASEYVRLFQEVQYRSLNFLIPGCRVQDVMLVQKPKEQKHVLISGPYEYSKKGFGVCSTPAIVRNPSTKLHLKHASFFQGLLSFKLSSQNVQLLIYCLG